MRRAALLCILAITLLASPPAAAQSRSTPVGTIEKGCASGTKLSFGVGGMLRVNFGCMIERSAGLDPRSPSFEQDVRAAFTGKLGRTPVKNVAEPLIAKWVSTPETSLIPRAGFRPLRVERVVVITDRTPDAFRFEGELVAEAAGGEARRHLSGAYALDHGVWQLKELVFAEPPPAS